MCLERFSASDSILRAQSRDLAQTRPPAMDGVTETPAEFVLSSQLWRSVMSHVPVLPPAPTPPVPSWGTAPTEQHKAKNKKLSPNIVFCIFEASNPLFENKFTS